MKRRAFIKTGIGVVGAATIGMLVPDFKAVARRMILEDIEELDIKEDSVDLFIGEAEKEGFWDEFSLPRKAFISIQHSLSPLQIKLPYYNKYRLSRDQITGQFLLSTDLFYDVSGSGKGTSYLRFYNPYKSPCSNPFASNHPGTKMMLLTTQ